VAPKVAPIHVQSLSAPCEMFTVDRSATPGDAMTPNNRRRNVRCAHCNKFVLLLQQLFISTADFGALVDLEILDLAHLAVLIVDQRLELRKIGQLIA